MDRRVTRAHELADEGRWVDVRLLLEDHPTEELAAADVELLAIAAGLTGHDDQAGDAWERAHAAWHQSDQPGRAARCAFWLGMDLVRRGQMAPAMGWFQRGQRILDDAGFDGAERWLLRTPSALQDLSADPAAALEVFQAVTDAAGRDGDREIAALGRLGTGQALLQLGDVTAGVAMLDEAMAAALAGDVMPVATGIIYCAVILECRRIFDVRRAREWTAALSAWCDRQQGLVPYRGQCLVHRSEVAQANGDWATAWNEATAACDHLSDPAGDPVLGMALYQRAELRRLRGEFADAEDDYRLAAEHGRRTEPGWQLLQLARGDVAAADAGIRRARAEAHGPVERARVLAAFVEIVLAAGDGEAARDAAAELGELAEQFGSPQLEATAAQCDAAVLLAEGEPEQALMAAGRSEALWRQLGAPYEAARARLLRSEGCRQLGDTTTAELERSAAVKALETLGATADLAGLRGGAGAGPETPGGLSPREVEVIALVARGLTNKQIASDLVISEKTVARHLSNIFTKIGVTSRSAATAWAFRQGMAGPS